MNKKDNPNYRLRNINMSDDLFHAMEYIGSKNNRSASGEMITAMENHAAAFKDTNSDLPDVLITESRKAKMSTKRRML